MWLGRFLWLKTAAGFRLDRRLLWEQEVPILDVVVVGDQMLVLDTEGIARYEQRDAKWQKMEAVALDIAGGTGPSRALDCEREFGDRGGRGRDLPGNVEAERGDRMPAGRAFYGGAKHYRRGWAGSPISRTRRSAGDHIVGAADGRTYVYDSARKQLSVADGWNDFAVVASSCTSAKIIAAYSASNSLAIFDLVNQGPVRVSDAMEVPGPVTALWPAGNAALAVVRNKDTNRYEAYSIAVDCGR